MKKLKAHADVEICFRQFVTTNFISKGIINQLPVYILSNSSINSTFRLSVERPFPVRSPKFCK